METDWQEVRDRLVNEYELAICTISDMMLIEGRQRILKNYESST